jgi:hypothetical protein
VTDVGGGGYRNSESECRSQQHQHLALKQKQKQTKKKKKKQKQKYQQPVSTRLPLDNFFHFSQALSQLSYAGLNTMAIFMVFKHLGRIQKLDLIVAVAVSVSVQL